MPVNWVICGGESGPRARPMQLGWARSLRDQCQAAGVPFFMKQLGSKPKGWCVNTLLDSDCTPPGDCDLYEASEQSAPCEGRCYFMTNKKGGDPSEWPEDLRVREYPA